MTGPGAYTPRSGDRVNVTRTTRDGTSATCQGLITFDEPFSEDTRFRLGHTAYPSADAARARYGITQTITPVPADGTPDV
ncbi:hypothetical protein [Streptomyces iconiensis]|uniref:Uncharacterized protein n=1 Tax=Streptomyces iconiensis TaxID=1384038 RepID=A0ABT6ZRT2_9ACTN|nr:hypothetical protein [Streptomyces iconiensis]MDJ1131218.1 hypothetical protein [Streptomyces iconiensis]